MTIFIVIYLYQTFWENDRINESRRTGDAIPVDH